jgi:hypothetical protein
MTRSHAHTAGTPCRTPVTSISSNTASAPSSSCSSAGQSEPAPPRLRVTLNDNNRNGRARARGAAVDESTCRQRGAGRPVPANSGGRRKRLPRAQIAWGERFHARGVPARRGRHGVPVAAPPKPGKKTVSAGRPVPANSGGRRKRLSRAQIAWGERFHILLFYTNRFCTN